MAMVQRPVSIGWPLSGNVAQFFKLLSPSGGQQGLFNFIMNVGESTAPEVEDEVLDKVAGYGMQLGRIGDALTVLLQHFDPKVPLTREEDKAIRQLQYMLDDIANIKEKHELPAHRITRHAWGPREPDAERTAQ